jgi:Tol biopolymer transport system component
LGGYTLSPDRNHVGAVLGDFEWQNGDLWLIDSQRGTQSRVTFAGGLSGSRPLFSPDGNRVAFVSSHGGVNTISQKSTSGTGVEDKLLESSNQLVLYDWSPDGRFLAYAPFDSQSGRDIWILPLAGDRKPFPFLNTPASEGFARFSPDSKWIAYTSDEGRIPGGEAFQIYVQPFPPDSTNSRRWQISVDGGFAPCWRNDGRELFYFEGRKVMAVETRATGKTFEAGIPKKLFEVPSGTLTRLNPPLSADGQRFLLPVQVQNDAAMPVTLMLNWIATVQK